MTDIPFAASQHAATRLPPWVEPALRHGGWFAAFLVLAPVIGPRDYGLFMLALAGVAIAEAALAEPAATALAHMSELDEHHWSTALLTLIGAGGMLWLASRAASGLLEALVAEPGFGELFQPLAIVPLLGALAVVPRAALRRDDRGTALAAATTTALIAGGGVAVLLAWAGAWSLVAQIVVQRLVEGVLLWSIVGRQIGIGWSAAHFTDLVGALDARAFAAASPAVSRYTACLIVGVALGPTATGLYMLVARLPEALTELCLAGEPLREWGAQLRHACRVALPVALATTLLPVALPPLIDLRWWGAVLPAQILLLGVIPTALLTVGTDDAGGTAARVIGGVALMAFTARYGLPAMVATEVAWLSLPLVARFTARRRRFGAPLSTVLHEAARPCAGAALAGAFLYFVTIPVGLTLQPVPALCLLAATAWLGYAIIRGEPRAAE